MDFAHVARVAAMVFTPSNFLLLLLILGAVLQWTAWKRWGNGLVIGVTVLFILMVIFPFGRWLAQPLEDRFPRPPWPAHVDGIVVLGGGEDGATFAARHVQAPDAAEGRLVASAELARRYPQAKLIFSGGTAAFAKGGLPEASVAREIYVQMGLPRERMIAEDRARNTWENLLYAKDIAKPKRGETWLLVTSAVHMPRAMGIAARLHWQMVAWPADYLTTGNAEDQSFNDSLAARLSSLEAVAHEWAGLLVYRATGRWAEPDGNQPQ
jgi:uncharacterized SAM-binding protein YcdF (DUF218 family)